MTEEDMQKKILFLEDQIKLLNVDVAAQIAALRTLLHVVYAVSYAPHKEALKEQMEFLIADAVNTKVINTDYEDDIIEVKARTAVYLERFYNGLLDEFKLKGI